MSGCSGGLAPPESRYTCCLPKRINSRGRQRRKYCAGSKEKSSLLPPTLPCSFTRVSGNSASIKQRRCFVGGYERAGAPRVKERGAKRKPRAGPGVRNKNPRAKRGNRPGAKCLKV